MKRKAAITEKQWDKSVDELRQLIRSEVEAFPPDFPEGKAERKRLGREDKEYFFRTYLPHYFFDPGAPFHDEMHDLAEEPLVAIAAPTGHAKSTHMSFAEPVRDIAYGLEKFMIIFQASADLAEDLTTAIKLEFEENARLIADFGLKVKKAGSSYDDFVINDCRVLARGRGQKIRGLKHKQYRPTKVVLDDVEGEEVENPEQRKKTLKWILSDVRSRLDPKRSKMFIIGTILHEDSVLAQLTDPRKNKKWVKRVYRAIVPCAAQGTGHRAQGETLEPCAFNLAPEKVCWPLESPFDEEMDLIPEKLAAIDAECEALWPARWSLVKLLEEWAVMGTYFFGRDYMNVSNDAENQAFRESYIRWFDGDLVPRPARLASYCDPSVGKNKKSDLTSQVIGGRTADGFIDVWDAVIKRMPPPDEVAMLFRTAQQYDLYDMGFEDNVFATVVVFWVHDKAKETGHYIPVRGITQTGNKEQRILSISPLVEHGTIRFNRNSPGVRMLVDYLLGWPKTNDDPPDALEGLVGVVKSATAIDFQSSGEKRDSIAGTETFMDEHRFGAGSYQGAMNRFTA